MVELACRRCRFINIDSEVCRNCGGSDLTKEWFGYVVIIDPEKSEIAKRLGIKNPGRYALKVG